MLHTTMLKNMGRPGYEAIHVEKIRELGDESTFTTHSIPYSMIHMCARVSLQSGRVALHRSTFVPKPLMWLKECARNVKGF